MRLNLVDNSVGYCLAVDIAIRVRNTKVCVTSYLVMPVLFYLNRKSPRSNQGTTLMATIVHLAVTRIIVKRIK